MLLGVIALWLACPLPSDQPPGGDEILRQMMEDQTRRYQVRLSIWSGDPLAATREVLVQQLAGLHDVAPSEGGKASMLADHKVVTFQGQSAVVSGDLDDGRLGFKNQDGALVKPGYRVTVTPTKAAKGRVNLKVSLAFTLVWNVQRDFRELRVYRFSPGDRVVGVGDTVRFRVGGTETSQVWADLSVEEAPR